MILDLLGLSKKAKLQKLLNHQATLYKELAPREYFLNRSEVGILKAEQRQLDRNKLLEINYAIRKELYAGTTEDCYGNPIVNSNVFRSKLPEASGIVYYASNCADYPYLAYYVTGYEKIVYNSKLSYLVQNAAKIKHDATKEKALQDLSTLMGCQLDSTACLDVATSIKNEYLVIPYTSNIHTYELEAIAYYYKVDIVVPHSPTN